MNLALITCGLPGTAYHGGAVTCWAIIKAMLSRGHKATVISLFDNSDFNPYLESKNVQTKALYEIGAKAEFVEYAHKELMAYNNSVGSVGIVSKALKGVDELLYPEMGRYFPWVRLRPFVRKKLGEINPDAIFAYHFDALSAIYDTDMAPVMSGVGDLWHLPSYFRWKAKDFSIRKYFVDYPHYFVFRNISKKLMAEMLKPCRKRGAFAAHYADWLRKQNGFKDMLYLRTPAHDPVGSDWLKLKEDYKNKRDNKKPKILMIGDITATAAKWGLRLLVGDILPVLEKRLGADGFEIHLVGGGKIGDEFKTLHNLPYIKIRGRVAPPDAEFLSSDILFVPTPITLGIRVRIITGFSYGSCVVAHKANTCGIPEIIHESNALVSDSGAGLAQEIIRALDNMELRRKLEKNARMTFEKYFSEKTAAERIVEELESIAVK